MVFDDHLNRDAPWDDVSALYHAGYFADAIAGLKQLLAAEPNNFVTRQALAQTALIHGDHGLAVTHYRTLAKDRGVEDDHVGYLSALVLSGKQQQFKGAMPSNAAAWSRIVQTLSDLGELAVARQVVSDARTRWPDDVDLKIDEGVVTSALGQGTEALRMFEDAYAKRPNDPAAAYNVARTALSMGDRQRSAQVAVTLLSIDSNHVNAYRLLGSLRDPSVWTDERTSALTKLAEDTRWDDMSRAHLIYALGSAHDLRGDIARAVVRYRDAGAYARRAAPYDVAADLAALDRIGHVFQAPLQNAKTSVTAGNALVVIIGLPRSGTTLVEQIVAAHSKAKSAGETGVLRDAVLRLFAGQFGPRTPIGLEFARGMQQPAVRALRGFGQDVRSTYGKLGIKASFIVEKAPRNLHYAAAIAASDPNARLIFVRRDLRDVCVSCMTMDFGGTYGFCDDLDDFVTLANASVRYMDDLTAAYPDRVWTVDYEKLVDDPDVEIPRLMSFAGLEMEPACFRPDLAETPVITASAGQVRTPINNKAIGRWKRYESEIGGHLEQLAPAS